MKKIKNIVILAGGNGDRFWPFKEKFLIPFLGRPFLLHMLDKLTPYGENMIIICSKDNKDRIKGLVEDRASLLIQEDGTDGMAGAVLACKGQVHGPALVIGNDFVDFDIVAKLAEKAETTNAEMLFVARKMNSVYFPGGYLVIKNGKLTGLIEKPDPDNVPSDFVRLVIDYYRDIDVYISILESINPGNDEWYELGMNEYIARGNAGFVEYEGIWQALKYPWHILQMDRIFHTGMNGQTVDKTAIISPLAKVEGPVHIGKNCKIGDYAKIVGPSYIGDNTIIGDYSLFRESSIGNGALVGSGCEVARSYLGDGVSLHRNYVGDSLIGNGVLFGAGAVTANFRFDQKNVPSVVGGKKIDSNMTKLGALIGNNTKIGVNASIFPGVKIGAGSAVAPGEIVATDVPEKTFLSDGKQVTNKL